MLAPKSRPAAHKGLTGFILKKLAKSTSSAKVLIAAAEDLPQVLLQSTLLALAGSSGQMVIVLCTTAKLLVTVAAQVPVLFANDLHTAGHLAAARVYRVLSAPCQSNAAQRHPLILKWTTSLARHVWESGDAPGALELEQRVLDLRRQAQGDRHPDTLMSMANLAVS